MQPTLCSRCKKNVAVVFISKMEGDKTTNEGLCLKCAKELGLPQVDDMMKRMGISDEDLDTLNNEMLQAMSGVENIEDLPGGEDAGEEEEKLKFIPTVEIFKEIMVELMKTRRIDLPALREERKQFIQEESQEFRLGDMVLKLADEIPENFGIEHIETYRLEREEPVVFEGVFSEDGSVKSIRCSDVLIRVRKKV